jgi:hypothetical protein
MAAAPSDLGTIVRIARERSLDDAPLLALKLLMEAFPGVNSERLIDVLVGISKIEATPAGAFSVIPDDSFDASWHRDETRRLHQPHVRIDGAWHVAYGAVTDLGEKDESAILGLTETQIEMAFLAWASEQGAFPERTPENLRIACRPMQYAKKPLQDRLLYLDTGPETAALFRKGRCPPRIAVLFTPTEALPFWAKGASDPQEAFDAGYAEGWHFRRLGCADNWDPKEEDEQEEMRLEPRREARRHTFPHPEPETTPDLGPLRARILKQAEEGAGFLTLDWGEGPVAVPRAPFERWALRPSGSEGGERLEHAPPWENVCPHSLKMSGDNVDHSDWMVGAGLELDAMYTGFFKRGHDGERAKRIRDAAEAAVAEVQRIRLGRKHAVLSGSGQVAGPVWIGVPGETPPPGVIVVVRSASPDWLPAVMAATEQGGGGLVVERGGALAHLISELRARAVPILRWPGALKEVYDGMPLRLDLEHGLAEALPHYIEEPAMPGLGR